MGARRLRLSDFETEVLGLISDGFRFSDPGLADLKLVVDRNLFDSDMPDPSEIAITASDSDNGFAYDPIKEPLIAIYRQPGSGIDPTSSSGSRLAFNNLLVLRASKTLGQSRDLLGELIVWMELNIPGSETAHYEIRGFRTLGMPVAAERLPNDASKSSATVRFLAVAKL